MEFKFEFLCTVSSDEVQSILGCGSYLNLQSVVYREQFQGKRPKRMHPRPSNFILYRNTSTYGLEPRGVSVGSPCVSVSFCHHVGLGRHIVRFPLRGYTAALAAAAELHDDCCSSASPSTETILVLIATVKNRRQRSTRRRSAIATRPIWLDMIVVVKSLTGQAAQPLHVEVEPNRAAH